MNQSSTVESPRTGLSHVTREFRASWPWLALAAMVVVVSGIAILIVHYSTGINVQVLVVDPAAEVGLAPYVGVFTHIGVLTLWSGATVCVLAGLLSRRIVSLNPTSRLLLWFGALMALLAIDDLFLIHEEVGLWLAERLNRLDDRSLLESPAFVLYGLIWLSWLIRYRKTISRTPYLLLLLAFVALGASIMIDVGEFIVPDFAESTPWMKTTLAVVEDLAKLGGIMLLTIYGIVTSIDLIRGMIGPMPGLHEPPECEKLEIS